LEKISAKAPQDGAPCVTYIGPNGAGHYVKMVHNGIEYGDEELIDESYNIMRNVAGLSVDEMSDIFTDWNKGELSSYLIEITADILSRKDDLGADKTKPIVDMILDRGNNKGTGKWSSEDALNVQVPQSVITEAVYARYISMMKNERVAASKKLAGPTADVDLPAKEELVEKIRQALYFSKIMSYAQGFEQLRFASEHYGWDLKFGELAQIWRAGCIIRAQFLQNITDAFDKKPDLNNLLMDDYFADIAAKYQQSTREVLSLASKPVYQYHHLVRHCHTTTHIEPKYCLLTCCKRNGTTLVRIRMNGLTVKGYTITVGTKNNKIILNELNCG
jgi:6-phosphogluconate dehydrogenase